MNNLYLKSNQQLTVLDSGNEFQTINGKSDIDSRQIGLEVISGNDHIEIHLSQDSQLYYYFFWKQLVPQRQLTIHLDEQGANAQIVGLFYASDEQRLQLNSTIIHHAPNTTGNTLVKGALQDSAKVTLKGLIKIDKGAQGSDDLLTERVLILSSKARAEVDPQLEIDANEVKATHAATISRINQDQLYYLRTRGVPEKEAQKFIVEGFFQEIIDMLPKEFTNQIGELVRD